MFWKSVWRKLSSKKDPPAAALAPKIDETASVEYWVDRLTTRMARLQRFRERDAPALCIEAELHMIDQAVAHLGPERALSVMRQWRELQRVIDPEAAKRRSSEVSHVEPN